MNVENNMLMSSEGIDALRKMNPIAADKFIQVPDELQDEAAKLLGDKEKVTVPEDTKLGSWSEQLRNKLKISNQLKK